MNMISTGSFLTETSASNKQSELVKTLTAAWEKKNSKAARAGGVSLMALSLAACGSSEDTTPFSQADVDAAKAEGIASVDITSDNATAMTSNDADIAAAAKTAALTATNGTIYATVDAAYDAGSLNTNAEAVTAALTSTGGTVYASVDAAVAAGAAGVDITTDNQAAIDAEMAGTGFADVAALLAAYNAAIAATPTVNAALTSTASDHFGTAGDDNWTAVGGTYVAGHRIIDSTTTDSDTLTVTVTDDVAATPLVIGIENINFDLNATSTTTGTDWVVDVANINGGTITLDVIKGVTTVVSTTVSNVATGTTVATDLATVTALSTAANADVVLNMTGTTANELYAQTGTADTLIVNSSANLTAINTSGGGAVNPFTVEEAITLNSEGTVTYSDDTANAAASDVALTINAKGAVIVDEHADTGSINISTTTGNVIVGGDASAVAAVNAAADGDVTVSTSSGDITVVNAASAAGTVTLTAVGDGSATVTGADGDVTVTNATAAATLNVDATGGIVVTDADSATTVSLKAGQDSSATTAGLAAMTSLTLEGKNASAATVFDLGTGSGVALTGVTINGANDVVLAMDAANLATATANTGFAITNAGTGTAQVRIDTVAAVDLAGHLNGVSILTNANMTSTNTLTVDSGSVIEVGADLTELEIAGAATPGNTVTVVVNDDSATASDGNAWQLAALDVDNMATVTVELNDTEQAITATTWHTNTGSLVIKGAGDLTIGTAVVAASVNASQSSGDLAITLTAAGATTITTGSGADTFSMANGQDANYTLDGGDGNDTFKITGGNVDLSNDTISFTGIEKLDLNSLDLTLSGAQAHGSTYTVVGGSVANDLFNVTAGVATGETINISGITASGTTITLTGSAGSDVLTGSSTFATTIVGGASADTIVGGDAGDTIKGGTGQDTMTGGAGDDDFQFISDLTTGTTVYESSTTAADVILDYTLSQAGNAGDDLSISLESTGGTNVVTAVKANAAAQAGSAANVTYDIVSGILTLSGTGASAVDTLAEWVTEAGNAAGTDGDAVAFEFAGDTYVFAQNGAQDILIELDGIIDAAALSTSAGANTILISDL